MRTSRNTSKGSILKASRDKRCFLDFLGDGVEVVRLRLVPDMMVVAVQPGWRCLATIEVLCPSLITCVEWPIVPLAYPVVKDICPVGCSC